MDKKLLALISEIQRLAKSNEDISVVWVYGSQADGTNIKLSDIDLAVAFSHFIKDPIENQIRIDRLKTDWENQLQVQQNQLSIIDINNIPIPLAWEIVQTDCIAYENQTMRKITEENRIFSQMEIDIEWHRRQYG